jgi:hypothetical protein
MIAVAVGDKNKICRDLIGFNRGHRIPADERINQKVCTGCLDQDAGMAVPRQLDAHFNSSLEGVRRYKDKASPDIACTLIRGL